MSLAEELMQLPVLSETLEIRGMRFTITGKLPSEIAAIRAKCTSKSGQLKYELFECQLLEECVKDAEGRTVPAKAWPKIPRDFYGPCTAAILRTCGMDNDDLRIDPNDSDSTES